MTILPKDYLDASFIARDVEKELLSRLDLMALKPACILDIGSGPGYAAAILHHRYPSAKIYGLDHSSIMLEYAKTAHSPHIKWLYTDAAELPFKDQSVDLIFSNLLLPWCNDIKKLLYEWRRVLRPEGLLMFTSFGPDTLHELGIETLHLIDMHDLGDRLLEVGFLDPVLDVDRIKVQYRDEKKLLHELQVTQMLPEDAILVPLLDIPSLTYEIVYAHAWGASSTFKADEEGVVKIPLTSLRSRL